MVGHCQELGFGRNAKCTLTATPRVAYSLRISTRTPPSGTPATSLGCRSRRAFRIHVFDECVGLKRPIRLVRHVGASSIRLVRSSLNQPTCQQTCQKNAKFEHLIQICRVNQCIMKLTKNGWLTTPGALFSVSTTYELRNLHPSSEIFTPAQKTSPSSEIFTPAHLHPSS